MTNPTPEQRRELAEWALGWNIRQINARHFAPDKLISDAWLIVEALREKGWEMELNSWLSEYRVVFRRFLMALKEHQGIVGRAPTAPEAIVAAAIKVMEGERG